MEWLFDAMPRCGRWTREADAVESQLASTISPSRWESTHFDGSRGAMERSRACRRSFCFRRVKVEQDDGLTTAEREPIWLIMEWPEGEESPSKFLLTTLPRRMSKKQIVRVVKERWHTEQAYEELKGELGLDHFEGRSYPGWHHHVSVVMSCYAFVVAERTRLFPPRTKPPIVTRSIERPERHFADSFTTIRLAIARLIATWLPRCPVCRRPNARSELPHPHCTRGQRPQQ
jgi:hypothetical protein